MNQPKVTVITVCYNAAINLERTMLSVLNQTYRNIEYIIIDGGSKDGSVHIINKYADRIAYWVSESDKGIYDAMNKGIDHATGEWINFMNAGDRFVNNKVIELLMHNPKKAACVIYGDWYTTIEQQRKYVKPVSVNRLKKQMVACHQAMFFKNDKTYYRTDLKIAADYDYQMKYFQKYGSDFFLYIPVPVCVFDATGISSVNSHLLRKEYNQLYKFYNKPYYYIDCVKQWIKRIIKKD